VASVVSDVFSAPGSTHAPSLSEGKETAQEMAQLAKKAMRKETSEVQLALEGKIGEHYRFLLSVQLRRLWAAEKS